MRQTTASVVLGNRTPSGSPERDYFGERTNRGEHTPALSDLSMLLWELLWAGGSDGPKCHLQPRARTHMAAHSVVMPLSSSGLVRSGAHRQCHLDEVTCPVHSRFGRHNVPPVFNRVLSTQLGDCIVPVQRFALAVGPPVSGTGCAGSSPAGARFQLPGRTPRNARLPGIFQEMEI